jgi:hypothetical protein
MACKLIIFFCTGGVAGFEVSVASEEGASLETDGGGEEVRDGVGGGSSVMILF